MLRNWLSLHRAGELGALGVILLAIWLPRSLALGRFATPDEHLWLTRSANFYYALTHKDFASTYQMGHPGVTIMWAGSAGFFYAFPDYRDSRLGQVDPDIFHHYLERKSELVSPLVLLVAGRYFLLMAHTLVLAGGYLFARKLIGTVPALAGFLLIAFDPFHIALNRVLHLDGLYSNLALLSLLAFLVYLHSRRAAHLGISAIAAGLSWLTKSPALLIVPVIGLIALADFWANRQKNQGSLVARFWLQCAGPCLAWFLMAAAIFVAFWPAMWVNPVDTLAQILGMAQHFTESGHESSLFFNGTVVVDGDFGSSFFYFYPLTYLWRVTPSVLVGLVLSIWVLLRWRVLQPGVRKILAGGLLMVVIFIIGLTIPAKKFDRYLLPIYAPLDLVAGIAWFTLARFIYEKRPSFRVIPYLLILSVLALQVVSALSVYPYYFTYYNPLMGGSRKAPEVMQIGWGEGLDQAARYLNQKADARQLHVITIYPTGCFTYFSKSYARTFAYLSESDQEEWERFYASDYALVYISQRQRKLSQPIMDYLAARTPEETIWLNGIEYVRIYKLD